MGFAELDGTSPRSPVMCEPEASEVAQNLCETARSKLERRDAYTTTWPMTGRKVTTCHAPVRPVGAMMKASIVMRNLSLLKLLCGRHICQILGLKSFA